MSRLHQSRHLNLEKCLQKRENILMVARLKRAKLVHGQTEAILRESRNARRNKFQQNL